MQNATLAKLEQRFVELSERGRAVGSISQEVPSAISSGTYSPRTGAITHRPGPVGYRTVLDEGECQSWAVQAGAALAEVFPERHPARVTWGDTLKTVMGVHINTLMPRLIGIFDGATSLVRQGHIVAVADTIRAETLGELLDQADELASKGHIIAAAAVAGGALESHLRHLCDRHGIAWAGHGSISSYDQAIGQARKAGTLVYSANDSKSVLAWGGIRNDADHKPLEFADPKEKVEMMVQGIREFLSRVP